MILINTLIILLVILILFYLYGNLRKFLSYLGFRVREGLENSNNNNKKTYTDPGLNDNPLYLSTINAANINYLKDQVDELSGVKQKLTTLESKVNMNTEGIKALGEQFSKAAQDVTGRDPDSKEPLPSATGL